MPPSPPSPPAPVDPTDDGRDPGELEPAPPPEVVAGIRDVQRRRRDRIRWRIGPETAEMAIAALRHRPPHAGRGKSRRRRRNKRFL